VVGRGALEGVGKKVGAGGEAFGGRAEGGPPARAGFLQKKELGLVLGANEAGRDDLGVVEDEQILLLQEIRQIPDEKILQKALLAADEEEAGGIPGVGGLRGDSSQGQGVGEQGREGWGEGSRLTTALAWGMFHLCTNSCGEYVNTR